MTKEMQATIDAEAELRAEVAKVDPADQPHVLARHVYELTRRALEGRTDSDGRIQLLNNLVALLDAPPRKSTPQRSGCVGSPYRLVPVWSTSNRFGTGRYCPTLRC